MAKSTLPLNNTQIKSAKSKDKEYSLADGEGLSLRVKPNGSKLWIFNYYQPYTKKRKNIGMGIYPEVSLAQARQKRLEARSLLAQDIDPKEYKEKITAKKIEEIDNTLFKMSTKWFEIKKTQITEDYADDVWRSLNIHVFPELGKLPITSIEAKSVIQVLKPIAAKGSHETVKRLCQRLNEVMIWAVNTGVIVHNPLAGIRKAFEAPKENHYPTLKPCELPELMKAIYSASIKRTTRCLIEWQLHTMVRPSEAAGLTWEELDLENRLWNIPAERMKKKKAHIVPLSSQAIDILNVMKPISGHRIFVFPADRDPKRHSNSQTANVALKRMGFGKRLVSHGLRALASTTLNEQGFDADVIESALAHIDPNAVRRAYNRADYIERRRKLMDSWSEHIENQSKI
jgi:integrase